MMSDKKGQEMVVKSTVVSKTGATLKVVTFELSQAGIRTLTAKTDGITQVKPSRQPKVPA
jgi:hypothetical protein